MSGSETLDAPLAVSTVPPASVWTTFITHVVSAPEGGGLRIGSGGPKKQFATGAHEPAAPPQSASLLHDASELSLAHFFDGPAPRVQSFGPVPALAVRVVPDTESADVAPSADVITAAKAWDASSKDSLARWKTVLEQDFAAVNSKLHKANLQPLTVH